MNKDFDAVEERTLFRRICTAVTALILVVLLGFGGDSVALVAEAVDADASALEAISLTEEHSVVRIAPRTRTQTKNEDCMQLWLEPSSAQVRSIPAEGQVAFALMNGGRPRALHPTGPPLRRV
jgi:hypothetical protein